MPSIRGGGRLKLALEELHFRLSVLPDNVVRGQAALHAKPFQKLGIPTDFRMFHLAIAIA
jgi:hypothetical protein